MRSPAEHAPRRGRAGLILLALAVTAAAVAALVVGLAGRDATPRAAAPPPSTSSSTPTPSPAPTTTPTTPAPSTSAKPAPKATPKAEPAGPAVPHDRVAAAAPTAFRYQGKGFAIRATVCGMDDVRPLDPPGEQHHTVCWVQRDFGFAPGTNGRGTTYVLGHSWGQDSQEVLNDVSSRATRQVLALRAADRVTPVPALAESGLPRIPTYRVSALKGNVITLATANGTLRYTVRDAFAVPKSEAGWVTSLMRATTKHRLVLITCAELDHVDYDYNIVVEAYLSSSTARAAIT